MTKGEVEYRYADSGLQMMITLGKFSICTWKILGFAMISQYFISQHYLKNLVILTFYLYNRQNFYIFNKYTHQFINCSIVKKRSCFKSRAVKAEDGGA
jgi:hypothetical protein